MIQKKHTSFSRDGLAILGWGRDGVSLCPLSIHAEPLQRPMQKFFFRPNYSSSRPRNLGLLGARDLKASGALSFSLLSLVAPLSANTTV
jgi:hypothetical protein